ncbi:MAG: LysR family transcriptional regulator [Hyphomicrobiaceae bacterium]|nr:LysR family transcriptional regulator [Hyphomicrobiaceae bacterium]
MKNIHDLPIDLNLLRLLLILVRERSVTKAARALGVTQSAASHALGRLREQVSDPLLVRVGQSLEPTTRAFELVEVIAPALASIENELRAVRRFDPNSSQATFRIGMSDDLQLALLPLLLAKIGKQAPNVRVIVVPTDYLRAGEMLSRSQASTVVGYLDRLPAQAKVRKLCSVGYSVLSRARRKAMSLEAYCSAKHLLVTFAADLKGYVDESLEAMGRRRQVAISVPQFSSLPYLLENSELVATVPDHVAQTLTKNHKSLSSSALPFASPTFDLSVAWRAEVAADPAEAWMRSLVVDCIS